MSEETIFSKIIRKEVPANIVYEDEHTMAFLTIQPNNPGHTLVVPKEYSRNLLTISKESWAQVMETVRILARKIKEAVGADGINIMMNNESAAGQEVFHTHVHIIPRFEGDGYEHWRGKDAQEEELDMIAEKIKKALL